MIYIRSSLKNHPKSPSKTQKYLPGSSHFIPTPFPPNLSLPETPLTQNLSPPLSTYRFSQTNPNSDTVYKNTPLQPLLRLPYPNPTTFSCSKLSLSTFHPKSPHQNPIPNLQSKFPSPSIFSLKIHNYLAIFQTKIPNPYTFIPNPLPSPKLTTTWGVLLNHTRISSPIPLTRYPIQKLFLRSSLSDPKRCSPKGWDGFRNECNEFIKTSLGFDMSFTLAQANMSLSSCLCNSTELLLTKYPTPTPLVGELPGSKSLLLTLLALSPGLRYDITLKIIL